MAKCKHETSNGRCGLKDCYAYRHKCYTEEFCKCHKPQTKADRIRSMTDEELADEFMTRLVLCQYCEYQNECETAEDVAAYKCREGIVKWLQQPAEGE